MATFDYQDMQETASALLEEFGGPAVLYVRTPTTYSPSATPENSNLQNPTEYQVNVAVVPIQESYTDGKKYEWNDQYQGGTAIVNVDATAIMTAIDIVTGLDIPDLSIDDYFVLESGARYTVKTKSRVDPSGGKNCVFILGVVQ